MQKSGGERAVMMQTDCRSDRMRTDVKKDIKYACVAQCRGVENLRTIAVSTQDRLESSTRGEGKAPFFCRKEDESALGSGVLKTTKEI